MEGGLKGPESPVASTSRGEKRLSEQGELTGRTQDGMTSSGGKLS